MSAVAIRSDSTPAPYNVSPDKKNWNVHVQHVPSRTSSISSYKSNYTTSSTSTAPTYYSSSPVSPVSPCRQFDSISSLPKNFEPVERRVTQPLYDLILDKLENLHKDPHQTGCTTCFQRDLHALSLTSRSWEKAVRGKLWVESLCSINIVC